MRISKVERFCLLGLDGAYWASVGASAAFNTLVGVDFVNVALRNRLNRALADASTAGNAFV